MEPGRDVQELSAQECYALLAEADIGRVILTAQALPTALPVSYVVDQGDIVFRTGPGTKLTAAGRGTVVAFEVDQFEPALRMGWSVVVTGVASVVSSASELRRLDELRIPHWVESSTQYVRLSASMVTGRRVAPAATA